MYLEFFGFGKAPFGGPVEPNELFLAETHREALATFVYGIVSRKPIIMVTGDVGVGKTTVLRTALTHLLEEPLVIIELPHPLLRPDEIVREIAQALKMERAQDLTIAKLERLHDAIKEVSAAGRRIIFIVDEAQEMPHETLEFIRLMSNMEVGVTGRFQIVLVGQTELEKTLAKPQFRHLRQRIALRGTLRPLSNVDAADYLRHRLEIAGAQADAVLSSGAVKKIVKASQGIPRRINAITDNALLLAFGEGVKPVPASIVSQAVSGLDRGMRFPLLKKYGQPVAVGVGALLLLLGAVSLLMRPGGETSPPPVPGALPPAATAPASAPSIGTAPAPQETSGVPPTTDATAAPPRGEFYQDQRPALALSSGTPGPAPAPTSPQDALAPTQAPPPAATPGSGVAAGTVAGAGVVTEVTPRPAARLAANPSPVPVPVVPPPPTAVASAGSRSPSTSDARESRSTSRRERERRPASDASTATPTSAASAAPSEGSPSWLPYAHRLEPGETVRDVLMRAYGSYNQDALFLFHALNSEVANPENAATGDVIWVPVRKDRESGFFLSDSRP